MAAIDDLAGRQKILEGLWLIGIEPTQLNVDPKMGGNEFLTALHNNGVDDTFIRRAISSTDWRSSDAPTGSLASRVANLLQAAGYRPDEVAAFTAKARGTAPGGTTAGGMAAGENDPKYILSVLTSQFNDRTAGSVIYKAMGGSAPDGAAWNPFRTDLPPKNADTKYGVMGIPNFGPSQDLPQGPSLVQQRQTAAQPKAPGAPTITGEVPGPGPGAGSTPPGPGVAGTPPPKPLTPEQIRADLNTKYGWAAAMADIPEVAKILNDAANGLISPDEANNRWLASDYYKETGVNQRQWRIMEKTSPAQAALDLQEQETAITAKAHAQGITVDPARITELARISKTYGWSDQQVNAALASEIHWDPSGTKTGTMATLKAAAQSQLVPLSDQAMTQWAQSVVSGAKTVDDFNAYLKDQAISMFPGMAQYLKTTPGGTVKTYLDPYAQDIGKTLGMNPGDIDWSQPKWYRFANQKDPKTGENSVMNRADVVRTLITDPTYNYDSTTNGKQQKAGLARSIMQDWGFVAGNQGGLQ